MATVSPSAGPNLVRDAHYHAIRATATWAAFRAKMAELATNTATSRAREDAGEVRATTYARGTLGRH